MQSDKNWNEVAMRVGAIREANARVGERSNERLIEGQNGRVVPLDHVEHPNLEKRQAIHGELAANATGRRKRRAAIGDVLWRTPTHRHNDAGDAQTEKVHTRE